MLNWPQRWWLRISVHFCTSKEGIMERGKKENDYHPSRQTLKPSKLRTNKTTNVRILPQGRQVYELSTLAAADILDNCNYPFWVKLKRKLNIILIDAKKLVSKLGTPIYWKQENLWLWTFWWRHSFRYITASSRFFWL